jgi:Uma2 family endonuclease
MNQVVPPITSAPPEPSFRRFTIADVAALPSQLPSGPVSYELHRGRLVTMPPPGDIHGAVSGKFIAAFVYLGELRGHGKARGEVGVILGRNPDHLLGPDAVFIAKASLPARTSPEGYLETIPDLVVEVRSKNDTGPEVQSKVDDYLAARVRVVWVADPQARTVTVHRAGALPQVLHEDDTLRVEDVIPGFQLSVRDALRE